MNQPSTEQVTLFNKIVALLCGSALVIVVWAVAEALTSRQAEADAILEMPIDVNVFDTGYRGHELIAAKTPLAICFYTSDGAGSRPSSPFCFPTALGDQQ